MNKRDIEPGGYYWLLEDGPHRASRGQPAVVVCRRVVDFPAGLPPIGARTLPCADCGVLVACDPDGPHQDVPHVCMPCRGIKPLPFPPARD